MLRSIKYGLYGLVMAGMVAVPAVWSGVDKTVHLSVDGKTTTFSTTADHVGELLSDRGFRPSRHDLVAPAVGANVKDGMNVVLRRGRMLILDVDGQRKDVWTTAPTVAAALQQLGYTADDFVSVSRSRRLPLSPTSIAIRLMRTVTVVPRPGLGCRPCWPSDWCWRELAEQYWRRSIRRSWNNCATISRNMRIGL